MKKLCLGVLLCALLLCSYQGNTDQGTQDATSYGETIAKAQTVQVLDSAGQTVNTLSTQEDLTAFVENLDLAHWTYQALPEEVQPLGSFVLFQENTIQLGQTEPDGWTELCRITLYSEHCLTLEILDLVLPFTVAAETGERLASYFCGKSRKSPNGSWVYGIGVKSLFLFLAGDGIEISRYGAGFLGEVR